jgi:hypothetical protein
VVFPSGKNGLQNRISNSEFARNRVVPGQPFFGAVFGQHLLTLIVAAGQVSLQFLEILQMAFPNMMP